MTPRERDMSTRLKIRMLVMITPEAPSCGREKVGAIVGQVTKKSNHK